MNLSALDVLAFVAELAVYVAVAVVGWRLHPAAGIAGVLLLAAWWGLLHSPKAPVQLPGPADLTLRVLWFGIGVVAASRVLLH